MFTGCKSTQTRLFNPYRTVNRFFSILYAKSCDIFFGADKIRAKNGIKYFTNFEGNGRTSKFFFRILFHNICIILFFRIILFRTFFIIRKNPRLILSIKTCLKQKYSLLIKKLTLDRYGLRSLD